MKVQKSIDTRVDPGKVWPYFTDPEKVMRWCITFKKFEYCSPQRSGVGTPVYIEEEIAGRLDKMQFEVTDWQENKQVVLRKTAGSGAKSYVQRWSVEPLPSGSRVHFEEEVELPFGVIGQILGPLAAMMSGATVDKMLTQLKSSAEQ